MELTKRTKYILMSVACAILVSCLVWSLFFGRSGGLDKVCDMLNGYGYNFIPDDLLIAYDSNNTTISKALDNADLQDAIAVSRSAGFPSDINKTGGVTLILAKTDDDVITVYMVDGEPELCFIQAQSGEIKELKILEATP